MAEARILIKGDVQMVGFRYFAVRNARQLGIKGYVRNLPSGDVEVAAMADPQALEQFIGILRKGPPSARITDIKIEYLSEQNEERFTGFSVKY
jgi:acylphosphatase